MTDDQMTEFVDLYIQDELPTALRGLVETHLAADPAAARDAETLQAAVALLRAAPAERLDGWFTERLLDRLLRDQAVAPPAAINQ